jgi:RHS repeat-associated protein
MVQPGRQFAILGDSAYRFGFNGKLHDDDIYGSKNSYDYGMRMLDPRLGRFMSVDPLSKKFPELSSYQYASNRPIEGIDLDGLEFTPSTHVDYPKVHDFSTTCYWIDAFLYNSTVGALYNTSSAAINIVASQATATPYTQMVDASNSYKALTTPITWNDVGKAFTDPKNYEGVLTTFVGAWEFKASFYESSYVAAGEESMVAARVSTAETFYSDAGFDAETATKHMEGIDFSKDVSTSTLPKGTIINQWVDNTTGKVGNYFTTGDNTAANIGKDVSNSTLKQYTLTKDVNVLQSTAAEYKGNAGGGTQYFSPELPANVTEVKK